MFRIGGVYICVTVIQKNILWFGWVAAWIELEFQRQNCLHLPTIVRVEQNSEGSYLKNYLVIFCMYVFRIFHRHLRRGDTRDAHNSSLQFLRRLWGGGGIFHGILLACSQQIYVLCAFYVMISLCMFSYFHPVLGETMLPMAVDGSPWFLPCLQRVI